MAAKHTRFLPDLSAPQVAERVSPGAIVIQPVGAIEQHGPHLPLSTDWTVVKAAAEAIVDARGDDLDL